MNIMYTSEYHINNLLPSNIEYINTYIVSSHYAKPNHEPQKSSFWTQDRLGINRFGTNQSIWYQSIDLVPNRFGINQSIWYQSIDRASTNWVSINGLGINQLGINQSIGYQSNDWVSINRLDINFNPPILAMHQSITLCTIYYLSIHIRDLMDLWFYRI